MKNREKSTTTAAELDRMFDEGSDEIDRYLDYEKAKSVEPSNVLVSFPSWMLEALDREADRLGINRQAVIKLLIDDGLLARFERRTREVRERSSTPGRKAPKTVKERGTKKSA